MTNIGSPKKLYVLTGIFVITIICIILYISAFSKWIIFDDIEDVWGYLQKEKIEKIVFCWTFDEPSLENCEKWGEITEPNRIKLTLQMIHDGRTKGIIKIACNGSIKMFANKHKFLMPAEWDNKEVYSHKWESVKLREKLREWGFPELKFSGEPNDTNTVPAEP